MSSYVSVDIDLHIVYKCLLLAQKLRLLGMIGENKTGNFLY